MYYLYILRGPRNHLYVGIAENPNHRIRRHKSGDGAEFAKRNKTYELVYSEGFSTLREARRREKQIKGWRREKKENLIKFGTPVYTIKDKILDISVNLARVSDWILSENEAKKKRVTQFLYQTKEILTGIDKNEVSSNFQPTLLSFQKEFKKLLSEKDQKNKYDWAETALTWANILQHRSKLI